MASSVATFVVSKLFPYDEAFAFLGLRVVREQARQPYDAGVTVDWEGKGILTIGSVRNSSPAEDAGLQPGDEIISLGRKNIARENWLVFAQPLQARGSHSHYR